MAAQRVWQPSRQQLSRRHGAGAGARWRQPLSSNGGGGRPTAPHSPSRAPPRSLPAARLPAARPPSRLPAQIRINPGNFADGRKTFEEINYDDPAQFEAERAHIEEVFTPLVRCSEGGLCYESARAALPVVPPLVWCVLGKVLGLF